MPYSIFISVLFHSIILYPVFFAFLFVLISISSVLSHSVVFPFLFLSYSFLLLFFFGLDLCFCLYSILIPVLSYSIMPCFYFYFYSSVFYPNLFWPIPFLFPPYHILFGGSVWEFSGSQNDQAVQ